MDVSLFPQLIRAEAGAHYSFLQQVELPTPSGTQETSAWTLSSGTDWLPLRVVSLITHLT